MFCRSVGWIYRPIHPPPLPSPIIEKVNCVGRSVTETLRVVQSLNQVDRASGRELTPADWKPGQPTIVNTIPGIHNYYSRLQRSERVESYWTTKFNLWFYNHQVLLCEYSCEKTLVLVSISYFNSNWNVSWCLMFICLGCWAGASEASQGDWAFRGRHERGKKILHTSKRSYLNM